MAGNIYTSVSPVFDDDANVNNPHVIMELSKKEWKRMKNNCITLQGKSRINGEGNSHVYYSDIKFGNNLHFRKMKSESDAGQLMGWKDVNFDYIKGKYFVLYVQKRRLKMTVMLLL